MSLVIEPAHLQKQNAVDKDEKQQIARFFSNIFLPHFAWCFLGEGSLTGRLWSPREGSPESCKSVASLGLSALLISIPEEWGGLSFRCFGVFSRTCCHMQLFLRRGSSHVGVVEGACARPSVHTPPAFARKDAQDTPAFPNQLLTPGVPSVLLRLCKDLVSHVVPKTDRGPSGGSHFRRSEMTV